MAHIVVLFPTLTQAHETEKDSTNKQTKGGNEEEHLNALCWLGPKITSDVEQEARFSDDYFDWLCCCANEDHNDSVYSR